MCVGRDIAVFGYVVCCGDDLVCCAGDLVCCGGDAVFCGDEMSYCCNIVCFDDINGFDFVSWW